MGMFTPITWSKSPAKWLIITAVFEIVLAAAFLIAGMMIPQVEGGFMLTAGILGAVGLALLFWGRKWSRAYAEAERIKMQGVPGQAQILGMRQTGVRLNEQPQVELRLQVSTSMHGPYAVTQKEYIPEMLLGMLTSGRPLPVKVDPANPQRVVIEWENAGGMVAGGQMAGFGQPPQGDPADVKKRLLAEGVSGTAKVISSVPVGQNDAEGRPMYSMVLQIRVNGHPPIQGPAVVGVPPERAELLEVGDTVPIKADANNPSVMAVDWENA